MESPVESPFRSDEPVSGAGKWIWLATGSATVWFVVVAVRSVLDLSGTGNVAQLVIAVPIQALLVWIMFRAAKASSRCRNERNFETMAKALRAQRRFWIALVILGFLTLLSSLAAVLRFHDVRQHLESLIEHKGSGENTEDARLP